MNGNGIGEKFDDFMRDQGLYDESKKLAEKKLKELSLPKNKSDEKKKKNK
jgi:hypothetical protein